MHWRRIGEDYCVGKRKREKLGGGPGRNIRSPEYVGISKEGQTSSRPEQGPETAFKRRAGIEDKGMLPVAASASASASAYDPFPGRASQGTSTRPAETEPHVGVDVGGVEARRRGCKPCCQGRRRSRQLSGHKAAACGTPTVYMPSHKQTGTIEHWLCIKRGLTKASDGQGTQYPQYWTSASVGCEQQQLTCVHMPCMESTLPLASGILRLCCLVVRCQQLVQGYRLTTLKLRLAQNWALHVLLYIPSYISTK